MSLTATPFLTAITDVGDSAVMVPLALAISLRMLIAGSRRRALLVLLSLVAAATAIGVLKVVLGGCSPLEGHIRFRSPSGHAALSAAVVLPIAAIVAGQLEAWNRYAPFILAAILVALTAASRVLLGHHSSAEVAVGLAVGLSAGILFSCLILRSPPATLRVLPIVALVMLVTVPLLGVHFPSELIVRLLARFIHRSVPFCA
jgi:membrane-associated phospholipid phosphatase